MAKDKTYEPFEGLKAISEMWEKQMNGLLYMMTDNNEFVRLLNRGTESHSRYMEFLRKNQELMAGIMNIPTKKDVANVAKLSVQAEGKIDIVEEQIWALQDSIKLVNKQNLEMFQELVNVVGQMKDELQKVSQDLDETKKMQTDLQELKQEITQLTDIKAELATMKKLMQKGKAKENDKAKDKELVLVGVDTSKS
ncbi:hypothetical protein [Neobacillus jeddahensis]|uniref:hypothetical protein n=1 Tax=Neobacillus jeddahensis TaxID=1461580 RepID=UPI0005AA1536|nr:hypothetical protein [Neobacillus jeddahensis]